MVLNFLILVIVIMYDLGDVILRCQPFTHVVQEEETTRRSGSAMHFSSHTFLHLLTAFIGLEQQYV